MMAYSLVYGYQGFGGTVSSIFRVEASSTLKVEVGSSSEVLVLFWHVTWLHMPEDCRLVTAMRTLNLM
jgi:hypothetical protein